MALPRIENIDMTVMDEFFIDFNEAYHTSEDILIQLEATPDHYDLLNALFRSVHTIKGNLIYVGLEAISPLIQSVEDILDEIRQDQLIYDSIIYGLHKIPN